MIVERVHQRHNRVDHVGRVRYRALHTQAGHRVRRHDRRGVDSDRPPISIDDVARTRTGFGRFPNNTPETTNERKTKLVRPYDNASIYDETQ